MVILIGFTILILVTTITVSDTGHLSLRDFGNERGCRYGVVINNGSRPERLGRKTISIPFAYF